MFDKWNERCPKVDQLSDEELSQFLRIGENGDYFSDWEKEFCQSCRRSLHYDGRLSPKREEILNKGLLRKLWDQDPINWRTD